MTIFFTAHLCLDTAVFDGRVVSRITDVEIGSLGKDEEVYSHMTKMAAMPIKSYSQLHSCSFFAFKTKKNAFYMYL